MTTTNSGPTISGTYNNGGNFNNAPVDSMMFLAHWIFGTTAGTITGWTLTDNLTSAGWTLIPPSVLSLGSGFYEGAAYKIVTAADFFGQTSGFDFGMTVAATGGATVNHCAIVGEFCQLYSKLWSIGGVDCYGHSGLFVTGISPATTSFSFTSDVGSSVPSNTDQIAWCSCLLTSFSGGLVTASTFQATTPSSATAMTNINDVSGGFGGGSYSQDNALTGLVQCSSTATDNIWAGTVRTASSAAQCAVRGATFYYTRGNEASVTVA